MSEEVGTGFTFNWCSSLYIYKQKASNIYSKDKECSTFSSHWTRSLQTYSTNVNLIRGGCRWL